jgi:hypothetical protein
LIEQYINRPSHISSSRGRGRSCEPGDVLPAQSMSQMGPSGVALRRIHGEEELQIDSHAQQGSLGLLSGWRSHPNLSFEVYSRTLSHCGQVYRPFREGTLTLRQAIKDTVLQRLSTIEREERQKAEERRCRGQGKGGHLVDEQTSV